MKKHLGLYRTSVSKACYIDFSFITFGLFQKKYCRVDICKIYQNVCLCYEYGMKTGDIKEST